MGPVWAVEEAEEIPFFLMPRSRQDVHPETLLQKKSTLKKEEKEKKKTNPAKKRDPATQGSDVSPVPSDQGKGQKGRWLL